MNICRGIRSEFRDRYEMLSAIYERYLAGDKTGAVDHIRRLDELLPYPPVSAHEQDIASVEVLRKEFDIKPNRYIK